jgi:hypothetical protein
MSKVGAATFDATHICMLDDATVHIEDTPL